MDTFMPRVSPAVATPDPSKHVNYTLGMVLGVDDFTQEFAYLSGRDQWLARDLLGYGTVSGLKVRIETSDKGPRVLVEPGVALSPTGQLIRVSPAQCAYLNQWLAANKDALAKHRHAIASPPGDHLRLFVVLCYRACATEMTPIPGEPCRSEDELMAPSRLADDFRLELRFEPPDQQEEDALRDFVDWLSQVEVSEISTTTLDEFIKAIREGAHLLVSSPPSSPPASPPSSPPQDFMYGSPLQSLSIPAEHACEYLRAAFRIWATELRPRWRPNWFADWQCCEQKDAEEDSREEKSLEECLLLAELDVPVQDVALTGDVKVDDLQKVIVNEERRPYLVHLRMLQEWLMCGYAAHAAQQTAQSLLPPPPPPRQFIVAAGRFGLDAAPVFSFGGLRATRNTVDQTLYLLSGAWFVPARSNYIVKGIPIGDLQSTSAQVFELVQTPPRGRVEDARTTQLLNGFAGLDARNGVIVRLRSLNPPDRPSNGFTVEISSF
ncbi:MAG TPA: hypothetical protein VGB17_18805 [Pyrinomonadaceae bacterium]|jgi:hypothetical protein